MKAILLTLAFLAGIFVCNLVTAAEPTETAKKLEAAKKKLTEQKYLLRYKFASGDELRWKVVHLVTTETTIAKTTQTAKMRSQSEKVWRVKEIDDSGVATIVHSVAAVDMWQKVSGREAVRYNSRTDKTAPKDYQRVAETVGEPLAEIKIDSLGRIVARKDLVPRRGPSLAQMTIPLPSAPVSVGTRWKVPNRVVVRLTEGGIKRLETQQVFKLTKVEGDLAHVSVQMQVLTPINDPKVKVQVIQRLFAGVVKFDLEKGRVVEQDLHLNESVVNFNGPASNMQYLARFHEKLLPPGGRTAAKEGPQPQ